VNRTFEKIASKKSYIEREWRRAIGPEGQGGGTGEGGRGLGGGKVAKRAGKEPV